MKKCPMCSEEVQDDAIKCKHCQSNIQTEATPREKKKRRKFFKVVFISCAVLVAVSLIPFLIPGSGTGTGPVSREQALVISRNFIQSELKYEPEFPGMLDQDYTVQADGNVYTVKHWVMATNAYGAKKQTWYIIKMRYNGGNWADSSNWTNLGHTFLE